MAIHDWTRVGASTFHDVHTRWIAHLTEALNAGILPPDYYAQSEQHVGRKIADVLTLHASDPDFLRTAPDVPESGSVGVAEAPPRVSRTRTLIPSAKQRRRTLTVRHTSGHRIIALVEIVSPGNKASAGAVSEFVRKIEEALRSRIHVLVVDLLPPGNHDRAGIHGALASLLDAEPYDLPADKPLTFVSYAADVEVTAYLEHRALSDPVPDMPLFLAPDRYINVPLGSSYDTTYRGLPAFWREVIEGRRAAP